MLLKRNRSIPFLAILLYQVGYSSSFVHGGTAFGSKRFDAK